MNVANLRFHRGVTAVTLKSVTFKNSSPAGFGDMPYTFASSGARTKSRTFTTSNSHTFGVSIATEISAKVGIPEVVEVTAKVSNTLSYQYQTITSTADMKQDADTTTFTDGGSLAPGQGAVCTATTLSGEYSTDYTNVIQLTTQTGQIFTINRAAHFNSVGYTEANVECKEMLIKDLPGGGRGAQEISKPAKSSKRAVSFSA
jgi:hypothetical protein